MHALKTGCITYNSKGFDPLPFDSFAKMDIILDIIQSLYIFWISILFNDNYIYLRMFYSFISLENNFASNYYNAYVGWGIVRAMDTKKSIIDKVKMLTPALTLQRLFWIWCYKQTCYINNLMNAADIQWHNQF